VHVSIFGIRRYRSFSRKADNIGDLTAKGKWNDYFAAWVKTKVNEIFMHTGEAQIAAVELLGMLCGLYVSKFASVLLGSPSNPSVVKGALASGGGLTVTQNVLSFMSVYAVMSAVELFCAYKEIRRFAATASNCSCLCGMIIDFSIVVQCYVQHFKLPAILYCCRRFDAAIGKK
jgi:hypothetical protein